MPDIKIDTGKLIDLGESNVDIWTALCNLQQIIKDTTEHLFKCYGLNITIERVAAETVIAEDGKQLAAFEYKVWATKTVSVWAVATVDNKGAVIEVIPKN